MNLHIFSHVCDAYARRAMRPPGEQPTTHDEAVSANSTQVVSLKDFIQTYALIGLLSFGGPAAQIAVMHRYLVERKKWLSESRFLDGLSFCSLLPGPEAMQLATYTAWTQRGLWGGLYAGMVFVAPGFFSIMALSLLYVTLGEASAVQAMLYGLKPAVLAIVLEAVMRVGRKSLRSRAAWWIAGGAFVAVAVARVPFPIVIAAAGLLGWVVLRGRGDAREGRAPVQRPPIRRTGATALAWLALWWVPVGIIAFTTGGGSVFTTLALFFSLVSVVTFGGAYSVLTYVQQQAVEVFGWLTHGQMLDALGLAETTPGPLIQVVQFVGFLAGYGDAGADIAGSVNATADSSGSGGGIIGGVIASLIVVWVTFVPCFMWVFTFGPWVEYVCSRRALRSALAGIMSAVVGVILSLGVSLGIHTLFIDVGTDLSPIMPRFEDGWASVRWPAVVIAAVCVVLVVRWHAGPITIVVVGAVMGLVAHFTVLV